MLGGVGALAVTAAIALYVATDGEYQVAATVTDDPTLPSVKLNGTVFHSETIGDPTNPVVIVLHGGPGADYQSLLGLKDLADEYFVVFYDQRGAGLSARVDSDQLTAETALADLDAFVEHHSPDQPVVLIGHSWGATLAAGYLERSPERVASAVLAEPGYLTATGYEQWQARYDDLMSPLRYRWLALKAGFEAQHVDGPDDHAQNDFLVGQRVVPAFANHPDNPYHCPTETYDAPMRRFGSTASGALQSTTFAPDEDSIQRAFDGPVLFLASGCNTWIGESLQTQHTELYRNAELAVIADSGHDMIWDKPAETIRIIATFLRRAS